MLRNRFHRDEAFSLTEILVTTAILAVVVIVAHAGFSAGNLSWAVYENSVITQRVVRHALIFMTRELREASNIFVEGTGDCTLNFYHPDAGDISYEYNADTDQIVRKIENETDEYVLAQNISSVSYAYNSDLETILIEMTSTRTSSTSPDVNFSLKKKVVLR